MFVVLPDSTFIKLQKLLNKSDIEHLDFNTYKQ